MKRIPRPFIVFSVLLAVLRCPTASASELFYSSGNGGDIIRVDTVTLEEELVISGSVMPHEFSAGPNGGLAFLSRNDLLVTAGGYSPNRPLINRLSYDGETMTVVSTRYSKTGAMNCFGVVRAGKDVYAVARSSSNVLKVDTDEWKKDENGVFFNHGPTVTEAAGGLQSPVQIAYSRIDGRLAVGTTYGVSIYRTDTGSLAFERSIPIAGINKVAALAFDFEGLPVLDEDNQEIGRKSLLYVADKGSNSILRFDATDGSPYGGNENDRSDPAFISVGTGGIQELGIFAIDPADGHFYVVNLNGNHTDPFGWAQRVISRFSTTGQPLNTAVAFIGGNAPRFMTFRPPLQEITVPGTGPFIIGPGGFALKIDPDLWLKAAAEAQRLLVEFVGTDPVGNVEIGGDGSGGLVVQVRNGGTTKTAKIKIGAKGEVEVSRNTTLEASNGLVAQGGQVNVNDGGTMRSGSFMDAVWGLSSVIAGAVNQATQAVTNIIAAGGGNIIATGGGNIIAAGGGNIISTGGGNIISTGGGNVISTGGGNVIATGGGNVIATGGGNIISTGGGNIISTGGGNAIPLGGGSFSARYVAGGSDEDTQMSTQLMSARPSEPPSLQLDTGSLIVEAEGNLRTGEPYGVFTSAGGSVLVSPGGNLHIDIGGTADEEFDFYDFQNAETGTVSILGNLVISLDEGFSGSIQPTDSFMVVRSRTPILGTLGNVTHDGRVHTSDFRASFSVTLGADAKSLILSDYQILPPMDAWKARHFSSAQLADPQVSGDEADPNMNQLPNWAEFAFDSDPLSSSTTGLPAIERSTEPGVRREFSYTRRSGAVGSAVWATAGEFRYRVRESSDLENWSDSPEPDGVTRLVEIEEDASRSTERVVIKFPESGAPPRIFLKVEVSRVPME